MTEVSVKPVAYGKCCIPDCKVACQEYYHPKDGLLCDCCGHHRGSHARPLDVPPVAMPAPAPFRPPPALRVSKLQNIRSEARKSALAAKSAGTAAAASSAAVIAAAPVKPAAAPIKYSWNTDSKAAAAIPIANARNEPVIRFLEQRATWLSDGTTAQARVRRKLSDSKAAVPSESDRKLLVDEQQKFCSAMAETCWRAVQTLRAEVSVITAGKDVQGKPFVGEAYAKLIDEALAKQVPGQNAGSSSLKRKAEQVSAVDPPAERVVRAKLEKGSDVSSAVDRLLGPSSASAFPAGGAGSGSGSASSAAPGSDAQADFDVDLNIQAADADADASVDGDGAIKGPAPAGAAKIPKFHKASESAAILRAFLGHSGSMARSSLVARANCIRTVKGFAQRLSELHKAGCLEVVSAKKDHWQLTPTGRAAADKLGDPGLGPLVAVAAAEAVPMDTGGQVGDPIEVD